MAEPSKLKVTDVIHIRTLLSTKGWTQRSISAHFNVAKTSIADINTGRSWWWLPNLDVDDIPLILGLADAGLSDEEIGEKFDCSSETIRRIVFQLMLERDKADRKEMSKRTISITQRESVQIEEKCENGQYV